MNPQVARARGSRGARSLREAAALRREMKAGSPVHLAVIDPRAGSMRVDEFCRAIPGFGKAKVPSIMERASLGGNLRLRELTPRQRSNLLHAVEDAKFRVFA